MSRRSVIALQLGSGPPCSTGRRVIFDKLCKTACKCAMEILRNGGSAVDAVCEAVRILEDSPYTNAGIGSNLTLEGKVECDASVMDGKSLNFGAVGAISDIKNPVLVAKSLLKDQEVGLLPLGRIPPCFLVSDGAKQWALEHGFESIDGTSLITHRTLRSHKKNKEILDDFVSTKRQRLAADNTSLNSREQSSPLDTIGAVCVDSFGNVASATSSGGLALKHPGRVGQAAVYAAGCWAENGRTNNNTQRDCEDCLKISPSVASVTTGVGENLIKTMFSRECARKVMSSNDPQKSLKNLFDEGFLKSTMLKANEEKLAGVLILSCDDDAVEILVGHTTASMCFAYMEQKSSRVRVTHSQLPLGTQPGLSVQIQGVILRNVSNRQ